MKTIVFPDGSIEATARADEFVTAGKARYATPAEAKSYDDFEHLCDREAEHEAERLSFNVPAGD
jgi:hypothetical protein